MHNLPSVSCCLLAPPWQQREEVRKLFDLFKSINENLYVVGGAVRDAVLGQPIKDLDFATTATPDTMQTMARENGITFKPIGALYGTVILYVNNAAFQITTLREDIDPDGRYTKVQFGGNILKDAQRRDFTINALYADQKGCVYAPLVESLPDLSKKRVRFIGTPEKRIEEDYLRILRYYRFAMSYDTTIQKEITATFPPVIHQLKTLSLERLFQELQAILRHPLWKTAEKSLEEIGFFQTLFPKYNQELIQKLRHSSQTPFQWTTWLWLLGCDKGPLTRKQKRTLKNLARIPHPLITMPLKYKIWAYYIGPDLLRDMAAIYEVTHLQEPLPTNWMDVIDNQKKTPFPLTGHDLKTLGFIPGPAMKNALEETLHWWLQENCAPSKEACLTKLKKTSRNIL